MVTLQFDDLLQLKSLAALLLAHKHGFIKEERKPGKQPHIRKRRGTRRKNGDVKNPHLSCLDLFSGVQILSSPSIFGRP